jgi:protocatechuate 3,4-dioxygenase beta subunit
MRLSTRSILLMLTLCLAQGPRAFAADTGSVSGAVFDQNGAPVQDATVKISGDQLPAGRTTQTDANGNYTFLLLLPGKYTIEVRKPFVGQSS